MVGLARTGLDTSLFLARQGARVTATDIKTKEAIPWDLTPLNKEGVRLALGGHPDEAFEEADLIVVSPGVPSDLPGLRRAQAQGKPVISEIELASWFLKVPIIAVTGTNGKSTTTTLLGEIFGRAGLKVFVGGNLGVPLIRALMESSSIEYAVAEVSSFQLELIKEFRPWMAIMLNLSPDHLDRHLSYDDYVQAKGRIFLNQTPEDYAIGNGDDHQVCQLLRAGRARPIFFGREQGDIFLGPHGIVSCLDQKEQVYKLTAPGLKGVHNQENAMAAVAAAELCGVDYAPLAAVLAEFPGLPHRMEFIRELRGVSYINDSKGTNVGAVKKSLAGFAPGVILIAGGKDKGGDYQELGKEVKEKVRALILLGEAREKMNQALGRLVPTHLVSDLKEAVLTAAGLAQPGDVVLLSPACASFDMFVNFEDRGDKFKALVAGLS